MYKTFKVAPPVPYSGYRSTMGVNYCHPKVTEGWVDWFVTLSLLVFTFGLWMVLCY